MCYEVGGLNLKTSVTLIILSYIQQSYKTFIEKEKKYLIQHGKRNLLILRLTLSLLYITGLNLSPGTEMNVIEKLL